VSYPSSTLVGIVSVSDFLHVEIVEIVLESGHNCTVTAGLT